MHGALSFLHDMTSEQVLLSVIVLATVLCKIHSYRYIRSLVLPVGIAFLVMRSKNPSKPSITELLSNIVHWINNEYVEHFFMDVIGVVFLVAIVNTFANLLFSNWEKTKKDTIEWAFRQVRGFSFVQATLDKESAKVEKDFEEELKTKSRVYGVNNTKLPKKGLPAKEILKLMDDATHSENVKWESGHVSGAVYNGQRKHIELLNEAFSKYSIANPLHPDIWPSVMKFDAEVIAMTADLVNGGNTEVCGSSTSGGTESIILAIKSHRDYFKEYHGISEPEMVVGVSAHAAVDKACDMMNIKLIKVPLDKYTCKIDLAALEAAIGPNTIMMYASAPNYPQGTIDNIRAMGQLAVKYHIGLHVDCCLGGYVLPFAKKLGYNIPDFDFSVPGVSSMSVDTHKYGYALKGTSVVLYRNKKLRQSQYFCYADWTGGMYTTPTVAGSRSGGLIAQCWASLMALGEEGYMEHTKNILDTAKIIAEGVKRIKGIRLLGGTPDAMIVCFEGEEGVNVYSIADRMSKRGWCLNSLQSPACVHLCCTVAHVGKHNAFLDDLHRSVDEVLINPNDVQGKAAIYGLTAALPPGPVNELLKVYNDVVLKV